VYLQGSRAQMASCRLLHWHFVWNQVQEGCWGIHSVYDNFHHLYLPSVPTTRQHRYHHKMSQSSPPQTAGIHQIPSQTLPINFFNAQWFSLPFSFLNFLSRSMQRTKILIFYVIHFWLCYCWLRWLCYQSIPRTLNYQTNYFNGLYSS